MGRPTAANAGLSPGKSGLHAAEEWCARLRLQGLLAVGGAGDQGVGPVVVGSRAGPFARGVFGVGSAQPGHLEHVSPGSPVGRPVDDEVPGLEPPVRTQRRRRFRRGDADCTAARGALGVPLGGRRDLAEIDLDCDPADVVAGFGPVRSDVAPVSGSTLPAGPVSDGALLARALARVSEFDTHCWGPGTVNPRTVPAVSGTTAGLTRRGPETDTFMPDPEPPSSEASESRENEESVGDDVTTGARMMLEPKTVHETDEGPAVDCPQCGATGSLARIIEEGQCTGYAGGDEMEVESDGEQLRESGCGADLSLELVWEA